MRVKKVILQQLASAEAVLTRDERELGTAVIDIGGGTTDIAVFMKNAVHFTKVLAVGGAHFTRDLAIGLQTPMEDAERIKKESGTVLTERTLEGETVVVPGMGTRAARSVSRKCVCEILRDRAVEIVGADKGSALESSRKRTSHRRSRDYRRREHARRHAGIDGRNAGHACPARIASGRSGFDRRAVPSGLCHLNRARPVWSGRGGLCRKIVEKQMVRPGMFRQNLSWAGK